MQNVWLCTGGMGQRQIFWQSCDIILSTFARALKFYSFFWTLIYDVYISSQNAVIL